MESGNKGTIEVNDTPIAFGTQELGQGHNLSRRERNNLDIILLISVII
jgi:hypothetical protein